jgi:hypothetical protein
MSPITRSTLEELITLSIEGLERMLDPATGLLKTRVFDSGGERRDDHLSKRYTVMSSLGLAQAVRAGWKTSLDPRRLLEVGWRTFEGNDLDHHAMALWANAEVEAGLEGAILPRVLAGADSDRVLRASIGREVAWPLLALIRHHEKSGDAQAAGAAHRLFDFVAEKLWCDAGRLFYNSTRRGDRIFSLFSTQIYLLYATAEYFNVFGDQRALRIAREVGERLVALRDRFGGWPWRYDSRTGRVIERYPVYSVHQDSMAPMAYHALAAATGESYAALHRESLAWLYENELQRRMVDPGRAVIYRAIRRRRGLRRAFEYAAKGAALLTRGEVAANVGPVMLELNPSCRPYHLGWILHAWCPHIDALDGSS